MNGLSSERNKTIVMKPIPAIEIKLKQCDNINSQKKRVFIDLKPEAVQIQRKEHPLVKYSENTSVGFKLNQLSIDQK